jgi:hypothetical protein
MARTESQKVGDKGAKDVVNTVKCPNCDHKMIELPKNYPLYDIQCKACYFRAQVKTSSSGPNAKGQFNKTPQGAGWGILEKVLKAGYQFPPLIVINKWTDKETKKNMKRILFYPFIPRAGNKYVRTYKTSEFHRQPNYPMFSYRNLGGLPSIQLYPKKE